jgi:DNA (cytosine-5)-methyltransferase 1
MRVGYLCSGIGCNILADVANGHQPVFACDIEPFPCEVLRQREPVWFPGLEVIEGDIRSIDFSRFRGAVDCLSFGFPCQDLSGIGSGAGLDGARSGLAFDCLRVLGVLRCEYAFMENVTDLIDGGLDRLLGILAEMGYDARWADFSAAAAGASHLRDRVWILAHAVQVGPEGIGTGGGSDGASCRRRC